MFKYVCQNFKDGQVLTADCLNKMEEGIENACQTPGPQGPKGDDGVSISHEWDGTTLKITSASGTSSADLRGPTGPIGIKGSPGDAGKSAYEYARDGGYMGSETKFSEQLAGIPDWDKTENYTANTTIVIPQQSVSSGMWMNRKTDIYPGIVYAVYISGEVYFCTAHEYDGGVYLGNITLMDSSATDPHNNEPFCVYWAGGSATGGFFYKDSTLSNSVTLKVTGAAVTTENKLPEKYLPDDVAMKSDIPEGGGGANIDVVASVGQTIVVEEVDADGKPTKWKAADYQERTHWSEEGKVQVLACETHISKLNATYGAYVFGLSFNAHLDSIPLTSVYSVEYDGVEYKNLAAVELQGMRFFGNLYFLNSLFGTSFENTGEPFILGGDSTGMMMLTLDSQETTHAVKIYINGTYHHPLDMCYFPKIPTIDLTGYYSTIENNRSIDISGDNLFEELYEVMRKNEIVRIVHRNSSNYICSGIGFVTRLANYTDLFVSIPSSHNKTLKIQATGDTATLYLA